MRFMLSFAIICCGCLGSATPSATTASGGGNDASVAPGAPIATSASGADGGVVAAAAVADDFESAALDSRWTIVGAEGHQQPQPTTAVLDTSRAHSGKQSLHIYDGFIETAPPSTSFYARAWVWLGSDPGTGHWMAWVGVGPGGAQGTEVRYGGHYDILQANYFGNDDEVISDPQGYCAPTCTNGVAAPVGRWSCIEVYFGSNELRFWLDGNEIPTLHVTAWPHQAAPWSPAYDLVRLGFHDFQGSAIDIWYDDVALGSSRLGCGG